MALITITFPVESIGTGDTLQLIMYFTTDGGAENYNAEDVGLYVTDYGETNISYDIDDPLLTPMQWSFRLMDKDQWIQPYLFPEIDDGIDPKALIELYLNGVLEFKGHLTEDNIEYSEGDREVVLTAIPQTDVLNRTMLYDVDGNPNNPFLYDPQGYYWIVRLIEDAYKLVDSSISYSGGTLKVEHSWGVDKGWNFIGYETGTPTPSPPTGDSNIFGFIELYTSIYHYFFSQESYSIKSPGDLLKKLAYHYGCFTGMIHEGLAFFKKVFTPSATQQLGTINDRVYKYKFSLLDWIRFKLTLTSLNYEAGTETLMENRYKDEFIMDQFWIKSTPIPAQGWTVLRAYYNSKTFYIFGVQDRENNPPTYVFGDHGQIMANFWYEKRSDLIKSRIISFDVSGVNYDFLKDFIDQGKTYQILGMKKQFKDAKTIIDAVRLS